MLDHTRESFFARQIRLPQIGIAGQERLAAARVAVVGVGALGCTSALLLARSGVGRLRLIDRDFVEDHNLSRQILYTTDDAAKARPKALAARQALRNAAPGITLEARIDDLDPTTIERLLAETDLIVDGLDNFQSRYLINDFAVAHGRPWIYGGAVGTSGLTFPVIPGHSACLRCLFPEPPETGQSETCETAGVLTPIPSLIGAVQATEAIKILAGDAARAMPSMLAVEAWEGMIRQGARLTRRPDCPCCGRGEYPYLSGRAGGRATALCGRDAVQVHPEPGSPDVDLQALARRLPPQAAPTLNDWMLRFEIDGARFHLFADGRAIVKGTEDTARARSLYARWVGS